MTTTLIYCIRAYQIFVSPLLPPNTCRFTPTCSSYAIDAIRKYGPAKGTWRALKRLGKCHPFHPGGHDPA